MPMPANRSNVFRNDVTSTKRFMLNECRDDLISNSNKMITFEIEFERFIDLPHCMDSH